MIIYIDIPKYNLLHSKKQLVIGLIGHGSFIIMMIDEEMVGV
jgi:hypothetical protein